MGGAEVPRFADLAAAILAGGQGRRLGGVQKALIEVGGEPIARRQLRLLEPRCAAVALVSSEPAPLAELGAPVVPDLLGGRGPVDGIAAALAWTAQPWLLVLACDMPLVSAAVVELLAAARSAGVDVVAPRVGGRPQPLCAIYRSTLAAAVAERLREGKDRAVELLVDPPAGARVSWLEEPALRQVDPELDSFLNLNRPADLLQIHRLDPGDRIE